MGSLRGDSQVDDNEGTLEREKVHFFIKKVTKSEFFARKTCSQVEKRQISTISIRENQYFK